jgi:hypothetical protein
MRIFNKQINYFDEVVTSLLPYVGHYFFDMVTSGSGFQEQQDNKKQGDIMSSPASIKSIKKGRKKRILTNREKLWKQVNKRITKIAYTLNPNSHFYEEMSVVRKVVVPDCEYDNESFQWTKFATNIDWTGLLTTTDNDSDVGDSENEQTENHPSLFNFDDFEIEDVVYEKMWN